MSEFKLFKESFCSVYVRTRGGGLPFAILFQELFCMGLEIFQKGGGEVSRFQNFCGICLFAFDIFQERGRST